MKTFSASVLAALSSGAVAIVTLIKMDFSVPIALNTSTWDLVWQRRYNLLTYSEQFDNAVWSNRPNLTVTANSATAPDGTTTAELLTSTITGGSNTCYVDHGVTSVTPGLLYTYSVYLKQGTSPTSLVDFYDASPYSECFGVITWGTTPTWTPGGSALISSSFTAVGGGWYRASLTLSSATATSVVTRVYVRGQGTTNISGETVYVWGAQLELGDQVSNYTPTTTTALTDPGITYKGAYGLGQINPISDKPGEINGLSLELHGISAANISLALDDADQVQGTLVTIRTAIIDTATYTILDAPVEWVGYLDTMAIAEDGEKAIVGVTAESKAVDLLRGNPSTYSDSDQRAIISTDGSFAYVVDQIGKPIVWPTKAFFYQ